MSKKEISKEKNNYEFERDRFDNYIDDKEHYAIELIRIMLQLIQFKKDFKIYEFEEMMQNQKIAIKDIFTEDDINELLNITLPIDFVFNRDKCNSVAEYIKYEYHETIPAITMLDDEAFMDLMRTKEPEDVFANFKNCNGFDDDMFGGNDND